jgi:opacity protein-like surface antigen
MAMKWKGILAMAAVGAALAAPAAAMDNMTHGHGDAKAGHGAHGGMETMGEKVFSGKVGPWTGEARLIDMKAQMQKSGVSAKALAKLPASHHLVLVLSDPKTGKPASGVAGSAEVAGPDKASSSKVTLVVMGGHIGADVNLPKAGKYTFKVAAEGGGQKGTAEFPYELKK